MTLHLLRISALSVLAFACFVVAREGGSGLRASLLSALVAVLAAVLGWT